MDDAEFYRLPSAHDDPGHVQARHTDMDLVLGWHRARKRLPDNLCRKNFAALGIDGDAEMSIDDLAKIVHRGLSGSNPTLRETVLSHVRESGHSIHPVSLAMLKASGIDPAYALAWAIAVNHITPSGALIAAAFPEDMDGRQQRVTFQLRMERLQTLTGAKWPTIHVIAKIARTVMFVNAQLTISGQIADTILTAIHGRQLRDIVSHPLFESVKLLVIKGCCAEGVAFIETATEHGFLSPGCRDMPFLLNQLADEPND